MANESFVQTIFLRNTADAELSITIANGFKESTLIRKDGVDGSFGDKKFSLSPGTLSISVTPGPPPENHIDDLVYVKFEVNGTNILTMPNPNGVSININRTITADYTII